MRLRQRFYVDPELQFPLVLALIFLVTSQGIFVGWGFSKAMALARDWQRPEQAVDFFKTLLFTLLPLVVVNFLAGVWLSHKIAGPLLRLKRAMAEVARGNLEVDVSDRSGDLLHSHVHEMARMVQTLRRMIYRDQEHAAETDAILTECRAWLAKRRDLPEDSRKELGALIDGAKARLCIINAHFMKGKHEATPAAEEVN